MPSAFSLLLKHAYREPIHHQLSTRGFLNIYPSRHIKVWTFSCPCRVKTAYDCWLMAIPKPLTHGKGRNVDMPPNIVHEIPFSMVNARHLSSKTHPHHDTHTCHGVAHLDHKAQGWWRANITPPPIIHSEQNHLSSPYKWIWQGVTHQHRAPVWTPIDTKSNMFAYLINMHLTPKPLVKTLDRTLTSKVMAWGPICSPLSLSLAPPVTLMLIFLLVAYLDMLAHLS